MATQIENAKNNVITSEIELVAQKENLEPKFIMEQVALGRIVILKNALRKNSIPVGIGEGLGIKINATIGTSNENSGLKNELEKAQLVEFMEADTLTDLSTGKGIDLTRKKIINSTTLPLGTVPMFQAVKEATEKNYDLINLDKDKIFSNIEKHLKDGVDFVSIHAGITKYSTQVMENTERKMGLISRCGSMLNWWVKKTGKENPLYENFDELLDLVKTYDATLSLGNGFRAGCIADSFDRAQIAEYIVNGELVERARKFGIQTMVEGGGHISFEKIASITKNIKEITNFAPLYMLGPIVTDVAVGYDNITSAIGATLAGYSGADFLCYVTPAEYLGYPDIEQVRQGIIAAKIAAHSANIARGDKDAIKRDLSMAIARKKFDIKEQKKQAIDRTVF
ncbi:MAG: phosphomethylpyrimidine synthase ThiC [Cyanobacteria bacterium SIG30]|nr:phosphomethylpyrimidine synthase ThiC [Cyanobacteria bacterium SIG30]